MMSVMKHKINHLKAVKISAGLYRVGAHQVARVLPTFRGKRIRGSVPYTWNDVASGKILGYTLREAVEVLGHTEAH